MPQGKTQRDVAPLIVERCHAHLSARPIFSPQPERRHQACDDPKGNKECETREMFVHMRTAHYVSADKQGGANLRVTAGQRLPPLAQREGRAWDPGGALSTSS